MRIALLIYGNLNTVSGGYLYDRKLVEHLRNQDDQVEIISIPWRNYAAHLGDNFSKSLQARLRQLKVDVLIQDELNHPSLFLLNRLLRKEVRYPLVSIVHHLRSDESRPTWQNYFYRLIEKQYLESLDALVFNSQATQKAVCQISAFIKDKPQIVAYPAGDRFNPALHEWQIKQRAFQPGPLKIIFVGNLIPRKGLHTLLESLISLPFHLWELKVIGSLSVDPGYARHVQKLVQQWKLSQQVKFLGDASDELIAQTLLESHLLAVPSSYEGFGIVYLEAMSFGLPAIGATAGGAREIITHGVNGFLIEPGNKNSLQSHLFDLASNRQKLTNLSLAARQRFEAHPGWRESSEIIRKFLKSVSNHG